MAVIVVIVIAMALLIHGCESSQAKDALKNYNANVDQLMTASDNNGRQVFAELQGNQLTASSAQTLQNKLTIALQNARTNLSTAESYNAPSQMSGAQTALVYVMRLREQGISEIATNVVNAASKGTSKDAVYNISIGTSMLYSSDVIYKTFVVIDIAKALNGAGIPIGSGAGEQQISSGQVVPDLGWLQTTFIAARIGAQLSTVNANANNDQPGLAHGHKLNYVTVAGTQLSSGGTYTIPANQGQTWTLNLTNTGQTNENDVHCSITIQGTSDTGTAVIPQTTPNQTTTCTVTLPSAPPTGAAYSVTARIGRVPGEKSIVRNSQTYTITFN